MIHVWIGDEVVAEPIAKEPSRTLFVPSTGTALGQSDRPSVLARARIGGAFEPVAEARATATQEHHQGHCYHSIQ